MRGAVFAVYKTWVILGTKQEERSQANKVLPKPDTKISKISLCVCWGMLFTLFGN